MMKSYHYGFYRKFVSILRQNSLWLSLAFLIPYFQLFQGMCVADLGFSLSLYKYFFDKVEFMGTSNMTWLTNFVGACWYNLFSDKVIAFRLLFALFINACTFVGLFALKDIKLKYKVFGIFLCVLWLNKACLTWFYYDHLSSFLCLVSAFSLIQYFRSKQNLLIYLAGFFTGLAFFARPPIICSALMCLVFLFPPDDSFSLKNFSIQLFRYFSGIAVGIALCSVLIVLFHHEESLLRSFQAIENIKPGSSYIYSPDNLLLGFTYINSVALLSGIIFVALFCLWLRFGAIFSKTLLFPFTIFFFLFLSFNTPYWWYYFFPGILFLQFFEAIIKEKSSRYLSIISIILIVAPNFCSNPGQGTRNSIYGMWFAIPLLISHLFEKKIFLLKPLKVYRAQFLMGLILYSIWLFSYGVIDDEHFRSRMLSPLKDPKLQFTFTTPERAKLVDELIDRVNSLNDYPYAICFDRIPIVHYLTDKLPYLNSVWPNFQPIGVIENNLWLGKSRGLPLPMIVHSNFDTQRIWPEIEYPSNFQSQFGQLMFNFMKENKYKKIWENQMFAIFLPGGK
ncbi:MAG: hypothetical protein HQM08_28320 [Candidatus Riflebacteria bacterium]|nr:hypothetical protein [Candidatus Riflebacteria bacterium]